MFEEQKEGTESFVSIWLKKPGERVQANEPVVEISTDKVSMEIPAPASGVLSEVLKAENEPVEPGEILGRIEIGAENNAIADSVRPTEAFPNHGANRARKRVLIACRPKTARRAPSGAASDSRDRPGRPPDLSGCRGFRIEAVAAEPRP